MGKLITKILLPDYIKRQQFTLSKHLKDLDKNKTHTQLFAFTQSSVFSSLIENSGIDLDNYQFNKESGYVSKGMNQIEDLINAYKFAKSHAVNYKNVMEAHKILSANFEFDNKYKGKVRDKEVRVGNLFATVYTGATVKDVSPLLKLFFLELAQVLKKKNRSINEAFYYASLVHLVFVKIHPFADGNGRISRLLEKWVLSKLIGNIAWKVPSEINYWVKRDKYYNNLNLLGKTYDTLNYDNSIPFLLMLPTCFSLSKKYY
jgi:Fic family protein